MKKAKGIKTEMYDAGDGFVVEITETADLYEAFMWVPGDETDKMMMFSEPKIQWDKKNFLSLVESVIPDNKNYYVPYTS